jgi:hypothetical protein
VCFISDLYPSHFQDWVDPESVLQVVCVTHADIGEVTKGDRTHKQLLEDSIFFYNAWYHPNPTNRGYGRIESISLPQFDDPAWPLPDMATTEAFRAKLQEDILSSMKPNTGSRATHLSWFMPVAVMVDLFVVASNIRKTRTLFVFKDISTQLFNSLIDQGWDEKITIQLDQVKCTVDRNSLRFKYHIGRSMLYVDFQYNRFKIRAGSVWEQMDQSEVVHIVKIDVKWRIGTTN